jgi:hypothetical protein
MKDTRLERVIYWVTKAQADALRQEAIDRAIQKKSIRPGVSEVLREILSRWMARRSS